MDCGYIALYQGKRLELHAPTLWAATQKAREELKVPKSKQGLLSVTLAEKDGKPVIHSTASL